VLDHVATVSAGGTNAIVPPFGLFGGLPGQVCRVELSEGVPPLVRRAGVLESGQWLAMIGASGGGYGDPRARDRALVEKDLREDRISLEAAVDIYGLDREVAARIRPPA
jgi:N-methylhydantoinase B